MIVEEEEPLSWSSQLEPICIGDYVALYHDGTRGYTFVLENSKASSNPYVYVNQNINSPENVLNMTTLLFQVELCSRYKARKKYERAYQDAKADGTFFDGNVEKQLAHLKRLMVMEEQDNVSEMKRNSGHPVKFGDMLQLRNVFSQKFICVDSDNMSSYSKNSMKIVMAKKPCKRTQFLVVPKFKINIEGEQVRQGCYVSFESTKVKSHTLHTTLLPESALKCKLLSGLTLAEMNLSFGKDGFLIKRARNANTPTENFLHSLDYIHIFHQEVEGYIATEGAPLNITYEDVHLRKRPMYQTDVKSLIAPTNPNTYWQLEREVSPFKVMPIKWVEMFRIRHAITKHYLTIVENGTVAQTRDIRDPSTVFQAFPVNKDPNEFISWGKTCRIQHVLTRKWIQSDGNEEYVKKTSALKCSDDFSCVQWDLANLSPIIGLEEMAYDDAYRVTRISPEIVTSFEIAFGFYCAIFELLQLRRNGNPIRADLYDNLMEVFDEIEKFLLFDKKPNKLHQKIFRSLKILDLIVDICHLPLIDKHHHGSQFCIKLRQALYDILGVYFSGGSHKNVMYMAKHFDFFHSQLQNEEVSSNVIQMLTNMVRNNRYMVDRIQPQHILPVLELVEKSRNGHYLEYLCAICVCDEKPMFKNQNFICDNWLMKPNNRMYLIVPGQKINRVRNLLYISYDEGESWSVLHTFVDPSAPYYDKEKATFLNYQLDLYVALCQGRNSYTIQAITQGHLLWRDAFTCLQAEVMPDEMRARFCFIVINLFVNVGTSYSVVDHHISTYNYNNCHLNKSNVSLDDTLEASVAQLQEIYPSLRDWILHFLEENRVMVLENETRNLLITQVLNLLNFLIKFGYFEKDLSTLSIPLLRLLDGHSDIIFPLPPNCGMDDHERRVYDDYKRVNRFKLTDKGRAIAQAKIAALDVMEAMLTYQKRATTERFASCFTSLMRERDPNNPYTVLNRALEKAFNPFSEDKEDELELREMRIAVSKLFNEAKFFEVTYFREVVADLCNYEYDDLMQKSVFILTKFFSESASVFESCKTAIFLKNAEAIAVDQLFRKEIPKLISLIGSEWTKDTLYQCANVFDAIMEVCLVADTNLPNYTNQRILFSNNIIDVIFDVFEKDLSKIYTKSKVNKSGHRYSVSMTKASIPFLMYSMALKTLKVLCRDMDLVKNVLYNRLNHLISLQLALPDVMLLIYEILTDRHDLCRHLDVHFIQTLIDIWERDMERLPECLDVIRSVCRTPGTKRLIKKNVTLVINAILINRKLYINFFERNMEKRKEVLFGNQAPQFTEFYVKLLEILSMCAELENPYIESLAAGLLSLQDLLEMIYECPHVRMKHALVNFVDEIYFKAYKSTVETGVSEMIQTELFHQAFDSLKKDVSNMAATLADYSEEEIHFLLLSTSNEMGDSNEISLQMKYIIEGIIPFTSNLFSNQVQMFAFMEYEHRLTFLDMCHLISDLLLILMPYVSNEKQCDISVNFFHGAVQTNALTPLTMEAALKCIGTYTCRETSFLKSCLKENQQKHADEIRVNANFQNFVSNCQVLLNRGNTVGEQLELQVKKNDKLATREYTTVGTPEELPLGREFQDLCRAFIAHSETIPEKKYLPLKILLRQLDVAQKFSHLRGKAYEAQQQLNVACVQILRTIIHNEVVVLGDDWEDNINNKTVVKQLRHIRKLQYHLVSLGAWESCMPHLVMPTSPTSKNILAFMKTMLFNASSKVQNSIHIYFLSTSLESFFFCLINIMNLMEDELKEKQRKEMKEIKEMQKMRKTARFLRRSLPTLDMSSLNYTKENFKALHVGHQLFGVANKPMFSSVLKDSSGFLALEVQALLCDGQFKIMQDYLRFQPDNAKSYNLVANLCNMISVVYSNLTNPRSCQYLTQLINTLNEFCAGNHENRLEILNAKVVDYINFVLRNVEFGEKCDVEMVLKLRESVTNIIISLTEEGYQETLSLSKEIMLTVDSESVYRIMTKYYQLSRPNVELNEAELINATDSSNNNVVDIFERIKRFCMPTTEYKNMEDLKSRIFEIGFKHYLILARFHDLDPMFERNCERFSNPDMEVAYKTFSRGGQSVEILKNDVVQRVHFRVKNPEFLRETVKEEIKWKVDRTSHANKLRDLLLWKDSVMVDIAHSKTIMRHWQLKFIVWIWSLWNVGPIVLSGLICLLSLIYFEAPMEVTDPTPVINQNSTSVENSLIGLGILHNILSVMLFISFWIIYQPGIENIKYVKNLLIRWWYSTPMPRKLAEWKLDYRVNKDLEHFQIMLEATLPPKQHVAPEVLKEKELQLREKYKLPDELLQKYVPPEVDEELGRKFLMSKMSVNVFSFTTAYYVAFVIFSLAGTITGAQSLFYGFFFFSFHLINIFSGNRHLESVKQALQETYKSLIWVILLVFILCYVFSVFFFLFFRSFMSEKENMYGERLGYTYVTIIRFGTIFDKLTDFFYPKFKDIQNFENNLKGSVLMLLLWAVIAVIMLNIINGIIVDKFAEIRQAKWETEEDMRKYCFICGRTSFEFETQAKGFQKHVSEEHNMWSYLQFMIYVNETKLNDLTAMQLYVFRLVKEKIVDFFPANRALSLINADQDRDQNKMAAISEVTKTLLDSEEIKRRHEREVEEKRRQARWLRRTLKTRHQPDDIEQRQLREIPQWTTRLPSSVNEDELNKIDLAQLSEDEETFL